MLVNPYRMIPSLKINPESKRFLPHGTDNKPLVSTGIFMEEIWKQINNYEGRYLISNYGEIYSILSNKILKPQRNGHGYLHIGLYNKMCRYHTLLIHSLVATHFISMRKPFMQINHKDGNKENNCVCNLEYCTAKHNTQHAISIGLRKTGELHGRSKLTEKDVRDIRRKYKWNTYTMQMICDEYKITLSPLYSILKRKTWKHI